MCPLSQVEARTIPLGIPPEIGASQFKVTDSSVEKNWEEIKEWKSLNSEKYTLITDYSNPKTHEMVVKGRIGLHDIATSLESNGMATFRLSFTLLLKATDTAIMAEFSHAGFDYYISSAYIDYSGVSIDDLEIIRSELLDFIRISRRFGNPVILDNNFAQYGELSDMANLINIKATNKCEEVVTSLKNRF